jgi:4-hydroxy-3-methylbut-2-enyl diphosphate reductase
MSWGRITNPREVLKEGQEVEVVVLDVNKEKGKISLSLKNNTPNPWDSVAEKYPVGSIVEGKVVRMVPFGAFVELEIGVDGLVHISQIANKHVVKPEDELSIGEIIKVKVLDVNTEAKKISLSKKEADGAEVPTETAQEKPAE